MRSIKAIYSRGHVILREPVDWPEGCEVTVEPPAAMTETIGIDESQWRDDAASLADWQSWLATIEPLELTPDEQAANARFVDEMRQFNIDAVRRQMDEGARR